MKGMKLLVAVIALGAAAVGLCISLSGETGPLAAFAAAFYGVLVTLFLLAQVYGFVVSQVNYTENVEEAKFTMLENELNDKSLPVFVEGA